MKKIRLSTQIDKMYNLIIKWFILIVGYPLHGYTDIFHKTRIFFKQKLKLKDYPSFRSTEIRILKFTSENTDINKTRIFYEIILLV